MRDTAFWERWLYLIFPNQYPVDPLFYERTFTDEFMSSFLNGILWAMIRIKRSGLLVNEDIQTTMHGWSVNADPLFEFLEQYFIPGDNKTVSKIIKGDLYKTYVQFCEDNSVPKHKQKDTVTAFTIALQHHGFFPRRRTIEKIEREVYEVTKWRLNPNKQIIKDDSQGQIAKL